MKSGGEKKTKQLKTKGASNNNNTVQRKKFNVHSNELPRGRAIGASQPARLYKMFSEAEPRGILSIKCLLTNELTTDEIFEAIQING